MLERADYIGGLLMLGIPDFKLEKSVVQRRVELMEAEGIEFRTGINVGVNYPAQRLLEEYDAVCLTGGSTQARDLDVPGRELDGVHFAMEYLPQQNRVLAGESIDGQISAEGKRVIILGGGDTGADCLGTAHRQGAEIVHQFELLPEPPETRPDDNPWPRWPMILRTSGAHEEGGVRDYNILTKSLSGVNGQVNQLHAVRVDWTRGETAVSRWPKYRAASSAWTPTWCCWRWVSSTRNTAGCWINWALNWTARGNVKVDDNKMTSIPGIFAGGDMVRGQSLVVWAIAEGRDVARGVDQYLASGASHLPRSTAVE